jgi:hypothetical protein
VGARLKPSLTNFEDAAACAPRSRIVADAVNRRGCPVAHPETWART